MTLKLKTPPMPELDGPWHWTNIKTGKSGLYKEDPRQFGIDLEHAEYKWVRLPSAAQLAARDAQWLALVGPVVEALQLIAETDSVDAALDPQRAVRVARAALRAITEEQE